MNVKLISTPWLHSINLQLFFNFSNFFFTFVRSINEFDSSHEILVWLYTVIVHSIHTLHNHRLLLLILLLSAPVWRQGLRMNHRKCCITSLIIDSQNKLLCDVCVNAYKLKGKRRRRKQPIGGHHLGYDCVTNWIAGLPRASSLHNYTNIKDTWPLVTTK